MRTARLLTVMCHVFLGWVGTLPSPDALHSPPPPPPEAQPLSQKSDPPKGRSLYADRQTPVNTLPSPIFGR